MPQSINVLVAFNQNVAFDRRAFMGAAQVANEHGEIRLIERASRAPWKHVVELHSIHGILVARHDEETLTEVKMLGIPFVSIADVPYLREETDYVVAVDETSIGTMAAKHFLEAGYLQYAVCAPPVQYVSFSGRIGGFVDEIRSAGWPCALGPSTPEKPKRLDNLEARSLWATEAGRWLTELPKPVAVFAPYDYHAKIVVDVAQQVDLRVPEDVAVVGVDDDELYCMTSFPQLSSVVTPGRQIGQIALETLLRAIKGKPNIPQRTLIPPASVMVRGSSSDFALHDPDVIAAVRFINDNIAKRVTVEHVADHLALSRRTLERRFLSTLTHTIQQEIRLAKVRRAKRLLIDTDLAYADIAKRSGFVQQQQLNHVIKEVTGQTPAQIRMAAREFRPV